jgi:hypothetical protein
MAAKKKKAKAKATVKFKGLKSKKGGKAAAHALKRR